MTKGTGLIDPLKADGTTPLITATMMGHVEVVKLLLGEGAETEKVGINGATALHIAASMGHVEVGAGAQVDSYSSRTHYYALPFAALI